MLAEHEFVRLKKRKKKKTYLNSVYVASSFIPAIKVPECKYKWLLLICQRILTFSQHEQQLCAEPR